MRLLQYIRTTGTPAFLLALVVFVPGAAYVLYALISGWEAFAYCPNRDVLSWDANLRFLTVLDMLRDFGAGRVFSALGPVFDSPTWPALRPLFALLLFAGAPGGPDTLLDVGFTYACFALVFVSMAVLALRIAGNAARGAAVWLFAALSLLFVGEVFAYALSAMLEVQGMLFGIWTAYFLFVLYADRAGNVATDTPGGSVTRFTFFGSLVAIQGLYHTKYPYGVMLLVALVGVEGLRLVHHREANVLRLPARVLFQGGFGKLRLGAYGLFAGIALLGLGGADRLPEGMRPGGRGLQNLFFAATLLVFIDFNVAVYRARELLRESLPARVRVLYWAGLFPAVAWMLVHPDRFRATLSTQRHVQEAGRSFAESLFGEVFLYGSVPALLGVAALVFAALFVMLRWRRLATPGERALFALLGLWLLQFAVLEFITPNKQLRHVYHLLPAALVLCAAAAVRLPDAMRALRTDVAPGEGSLLGSTVVPVLLLCALAVGLNAGGLRQMTTNEKFSERPVCFTGTDPWTVQIARDFAAELDPARKYVALNLFHSLTKPDGAWPEGRYIATDIDLLLRMRMRSGAGDIYKSPTDARHWRTADRLLFIADECDNTNYDALLQARAAETGVRLKRVKLHAAQDREVCMAQYAIREH